MWFSSSFFRTFLQIQCMASPLNHFFRSASLTWWATELPLVEPPPLPPVFIPLTALLELPLVQNLCVRTRRKETLRDPSSSLWLKSSSTTYNHLCSYFLCCIYFVLNHANHKIYFFCFADYNIWNWFKFEILNELRFKIWNETKKVVIELGRKEVVQFILRRVWWAAQECVVWWWEYIVEIEKKLSLQSCYFHL